MKCIAREWAVPLLMAAFLGVPVRASVAAPGAKPTSPRLVWRQRLIAPPATPLGLLATRSVLCIPLRLSGEPSDSAHPPVYETLLVDRRTRKPLCRLPSYPIYLDAARVAVWTPSISPIAPEAKPGTAVTHSSDSPASALLCYDLPTGKRRWQCAAPAGMECPSATRVGDALCCRFSPSAESEGQTLRLIRLGDGQTLAERVWSDGWSVGPPAFDGNAIYYGAGHTLMALDPRTLASRWTTYDGGNANPQLVGDVLIAFGWSNAVQGIDPRTGRVLWSRYAPREQNTCVVLGTVRPALAFEAYSLDNAPWVQRLSCVDVQTGKTLWSQSMEGNKPVASTAGLVYVAGASPGSGSGGFASLDAVTGAVLWRYEKPGLVGVSVLTDDRDIIGLGSDCCLYGFGYAR